MKPVIDAIRNLILIVVCCMFTLYQVSLLYELYNQETRQQALRYACFHGSRLAQDHAYCGWVRFNQCFIQKTVEASEVSYCEKIKDKVSTVTLQVEIDSSDFATVPQDNESH